MAIYDFIVFNYFFYIIIIAFFFIVSFALMRQKSQVRKISQEEIDVIEKRSEIFSVCFKNFPFAIFLTSLSGKILFINTAFTELLGYNKKEITKINALNLYADPNDRILLANAIKKDHKITDFVINFKRKDGTLVGVKLNTLLLSDGKKEFLLTTAVNVSKERSMEMQLAESHKKFRFLYENSSDAIMRISPPDWKFTAGNKATLEMFQVKDEKTFASLGPGELSPEYQPDGTLSEVKLKKMIEKAVEDGSNFFEWTHKRYNGKDFFATVLLLLLESHGKNFLQAIVHDISQQKKEEESFRQFIKTTKTKLSGFVPFVGKTSSNTPEKEIIDFESFLKTIGGVIDTMKERNLELENVQRVMSSLLEDVSKEKNKAEESKKQTEAIIESSGDGVFVINNKGVVFLFNPAAEKISGWKKEEVIGKKYDDMIKFYSNETEKEPNLLIKESLCSGLIKKMGTKAILRRKNGETLPITDCISPIKGIDGKVTGGVIIFSDASKEREIDNAKSEFVSLVSHQLRTPISSMSWFVEMLMSGEIGDINEKQKEYLEEISYSNRRMEMMVSMLLNISRIEIGRAVIEPVLTDMGSFIDASLSHVELILEKKEIFLEKKIQKDLPLLCVDQKLLNIVMDNLLSNAVTYTLNEGHITVSVSKNANDFIIEVSDDGIGIPKQDQSKIFTKLFRSDNAKEIDTSGTGIGLYMTKSIIESWNGTIRFSSPVTKKIAADGEEKFVGTSFFVTIPISGMMKKEGTIQLT